MNRINIISNNNNNNNTIINIILYAHLCIYTGLRILFYGFLEMQTDKLSSICTP